MCGAACPEKWQKPNLSSNMSLTDSVWLMWCLDLGGQGGGSQKHEGRHPHLGRLCRRQHLTNFSYRLPLHGLSTSVRHAFDTSNAEMLKNVCVSTTFDKRSTCFRHVEKCSIQKRMRFHYFRRNCFIRKRMRFHYFRQARLGTL